MYEERNNQIRQRPREKYPYLTPVNTGIVLLNAVIFLILSVLGDTEDGAFMYLHGAMYPDAVFDSGEWYRLLTSSFLHFGISHLVNNMVMLFCLGSYLEKAFGRIKYAVFYAAVCVFSSLASSWWMLQQDSPAVSGGASGAIFGIIGALLWIILRNHGRFRDMDLRRFMIMLALSLYYGFTTADVDNAAHIGGLIFGFLLGILMAPRGLDVSRRNSYTE